MVSPVPGSRSSTVEAPSVPPKDNGTEYDDASSSPKQYRSSPRSASPGIGFDTPSESVPSRPNLKIRSTTSPPISIGAGVKQPSEAPLSGEASRNLFQEMQAGSLSSSDNDITLFSRRSHRRGGFWSSSPDADIRLARAMENHENAFVRIFTQYQCQQILAQSSDMRSFKAAVYSCTELRAAIDVESPEWYLIWTNMVASIRRSEIPFVPGVTTAENCDHEDHNGEDDNSGEDEDSDDDDDDDIVDEENEDEGSDSGDGSGVEDNEQRYASRIVPSHWRFSATD
ncbi:hypothetical protein HBI80_086730 [Parastagonospora nodorum]|nr:hypothetical protein HBH47_208310 [Parastagonospora nodorum]KAH4599402.1 hypothetical protein HBH82_203670 [Parastagonospora nodorum]KAH4670224.1 hypothetical protein HBH78_185100 [Parastagonospora nodorum]KAH4709277.1 hypothetical protein HBH67_059300 [Parastagonospora nodorum]KAH4762457.1 hypothetical protein HBH63_201000 [Parastagonospora nodorum]